MSYSIEDLELVISESKFAGGKWCWSLWRTTDLGRVIVTSAYGFESSSEARDDYESFKTHVSEAIPKIVRSKNGG